MSLLAQGPVGDEIKVTFDRPVQVGSQNLPAGDYRIRQVTSASNPRVLEFTNENGGKLEATVTAIPVLQNTPPMETKAILQDEGGGARLSRIWVQGKSYGYAFPGSAMSASQTATAQAHMTGSYNGAAAAATTPAAENTTAADRSAETPATPAPAATPAPTPAPPAAAEPTPAPTPAPAAETPAPAPTPEVPATGLGWAEVTMAGLMMAASGLVLFKWSGRRAN